MANVFQVDYEALGGIATQVNGLAQTTQESEASLLRGLEPLENGDWVGDDADLFFGEMRDDILPAVGRLIDLLLETAAALGEVVAEVRAEEEGLCAMFR